MKQKILLMWQTASVLNVLAAMLVSIAVLLIGLAGTYWVKRHSMFNIKEVVVTGMRGEKDLYHQNPSFIRQAIVPQLSGNLMTVQLSVVQRTFLQAPWIRHVTVRRVWPNRLWVLLEEHQAVARLNDDYLVNQQGETYVASTDDDLPDLPALIGEKHDAQLMLIRLRELNKWLSPSKLTVHQLFLSERRAWTATLSNRTVLEIGRDDLKPIVAERVGQWAKTWAIAQKSAGLSNSRHIDLRYPNGYAIRRSAS